MNLTIKLAQLGIALVLAGCQSNPQNETLNQDVAQLKSKIDDIETRLTLLRRDVLKTSIATKQGLSAYLTPGRDGYSVVKIDLGSLTVSMKDVKAYANGSKVTLEFGNPLTTTVDGLRAKIEWGKFDKDGLVVSDTVKSREITLSNSLRPGSWTR